MRGRVECRPHQVVIRRNVQCLRMIAEPMALAVAQTNVITEQINGSRAAQNSQMHGGKSAVRAVIQNRIMERMPVDARQITIQRINRLLMVWRYRGNL